jgi:hypothetical protein
LGLSVRPKPDNPTPATSRLQDWQTASPAIFLGPHLAEHYTRDPALAAADKLKAAELRSNIVKLGPNYVVHIGAADLLKLVDTDETVSKTMARHLAEKAKNGAPKQREIAAKSYNGAIFKLALLLKPIITPSHRKKHLTPPEICVKT